MRIGLLAPISAAVPPDGYAGVEAVVALPAPGLVEAGHREVEARFSPAQFVTAYERAFEALLS
jgi:hypothetical protein